MNDVIVERTTPFPARDLHEPWRVPFPPLYDPMESAVTAVYQAPSFPGEAERLRDWLLASFAPDPADAEGTVLALCQLVFHSIAYRRRYDRGVQTPAHTLECRTGTCRDMATLMMDAARVLGVAARFASGYLHGASSMAGTAATHAWAEVYLPMLGWRGFDPTIGTAISAAAHRDRRQQPPARRHAGLGDASSVAPAITPICGRWSPPRSSRPNRRCGKRLRRTCSGA